MSSTDRRRFLDAVRAAPDSDTTRLVFADWLDENGDPHRAEFVRGQIRLSGMNAWDAGHTELSVRCRSLLRQHGAGWLGDLEQFVPTSALEDDRWPVFRRGFPERITVDVETFLQHHDRLFRAEPVQGVWFRPHTSREHLRFYEQSPLARLTAVGLGDRAFTPPRLGYVGLHESPHLVGLTELWLDHDLSSDWWDGRRVVPAGDLVSAPFAAGLHTLGLLRPPADPSDLFALNRLPALRYLSIREPTDALDWRPATDRAAWYHSLERLHVTGNWDGSRWSAWTEGQLADVAGMPELAAVDFTQIDLSEAVTATWDAASFWRSVRLANAALELDRLATIATAGPLAECGALDVSHNPGAGRFLAAVGGAPFAAGLRVLTAAGCDRIGDELSRFVLGRPLPELARLDVHHDGHHAQPIPADTLRALLDGDVCPRLVSLTFRNIGADDVRAVAESPGAARLRELSLGRVDKAGAKALAASPHLDGLELLDAAPADRAAREILRDRFGRRLRATNE